MRFRNAQDIVVTLDEIVALLEIGYDYTVYVGTDSQVNRKKKCVDFASCVVLHKKGKGGKIFIARSSEPLANSLKERLMKEVWKSMEVGFELSQILPENAEIVIHVDVNHSSKFKSGNYNQELVSLVTGQGFKCRIKPEAWCAQSVADRFAKNKRKVV